MNYEAVIGLEVHAQLLTKTKIFCGCATEFGKPPNTQTCPVCLGLPGSLPVVNETAVQMAAKTGLALNCQVRSVSVFARKNYFYPDLPKGYQISQYEEPICEKGWIDLTVNDQTKRVRIRRAHLEEDAGKNIHAGGTSGSLVDLNRAGTPLLEIVTEPDMHSAEEVDAYLRALRDTLRYLDVCNGNMEEGSLRCEPNLSLRPVGETTLGTKVELKNLNSFKNVKDAIAYEITRQTRVLQAGGTLSQETRLWDADKAETAVMRGKEEAHDYRYFPDPDLIPLHVSEAWIAEIKDTIVELPHARLERFRQDYGLPEYDAGILVSSRALADYFEACVRAFPHPKTVSNWVMGELLRELNQAGIEADASRLSPEGLAELLQLVDDGTISLKVAREMFPELYASGQSAEALIQEKGLRQISDEGALAELVHTVMTNNPAQVKQYRDGKEAVLGFLVGQVMKASGGKANPQRVNELLKTALLAQE